MDSWRQTNPVQSLPLSLLRCSSLTLHNTVNVVAVQCFRSLDIEYLHDIYRLSTLNYRRPMHTTFTKARKSEWMEAEVENARAEIAERQKHTSMYWYSFI